MGQLTANQNEIAEAALVALQLSVVLHARAQTLIVAAIKAAFTDRVSAQGLPKETREMFFRNAADIVLQCLPAASPYRAVLRQWADEDGLAMFVDADATGLRLVPPPTDESKE
jgi:hypothetical protein